MRVVPLERWSTLPCKRAAAALLACTALIVGQSRGNAQAATVTLSPGANIQAAVNSNPGATAFVLQPGVYRMQNILPKAGDSFTGQTGADLNGSQVLTTWTKSGNYWINQGAPAVNTPYGPSSTYCNDPTTGCAYPQDLYLNNKPLVHKLALPITTGQWYFDYTNDVVYMADNPTGQTVELSVTPQAFSGYVNNVTVQNLIVEKYASPLLSGTIIPFGSNWIIKSNEVRLNHSAGIKPEYGSDNYEQILSNNVHDNGQEGIAVGSGTGTLVEYNTVARNGYANVFDGFEEGGGKVSGTVNARVLNNTYTNNNGVGLWVDCGATGTVLQGNTVSGSRLDGIRHEISHYGTISNNTLINNAQNPVTGACTLYSEEMALVESDHVTASNNTVKTNCAGIQMQQGNRAQVLYNVVSHNSTIYAGSTVIANRLGAKDVRTPTTIYNPSSGNSFDYNTYQFSSPSLTKLTNWIWLGAKGVTTQVNWTAWQAAGQDPHGSAN